MLAGAALLLEKSDPQPEDDEEVDALGLDENELFVLVREEKPVEREEEDDEEDDDLPKLPPREPRERPS